MQEREEADWVRRAQTGDREAFAELAKRYWGRIFRWLQSTLECAHGAEDVTQDVFVKAWLALPNYREGNFRAWLFRIARNAVIDRRRGNPDKAGPLSKDMPAKEMEPLQHLLDKETQLTVEQACRKLPEIFRSAFLLWVREEMSYAEIALALDITEVTARWRVYRARRLLLRMLTSTQDKKEP